jgi:hypothetical protein
MKNDFTKCERTTSKLWGHCLPVFLSLLSLQAGCTPRTETARFLRVTSTTGECTNCSDADETRMAAELLAARPDAEIEPWFAASFRVPNEKLTDILENSPPERRRAEFSSLASGPWGFEFVWEGGLLRYTERPRRFFDGYLAHLEYTDAVGKVRWTRRVPFLEVPIYPFVSKSRVLYVGMEPPGRQIAVVLDLITGAVVRKVAVPYPPEISIRIDAPAATYPFEVSGALVLQGTSLFVEGGQAVPGARTARIPADILILPPGQQ